MSEQPVTIDVTHAEYERLQQTAEAEERTFASTCAIPCAAGWSGTR